jgi:hypothetical protein
LALFPDCRASAAEKASLSYQTAVYFHPFIRDVLFAAPGSGVIETLEHTRIRGVRVTAAGGGERAFDISRLQFPFPSDVLLLAAQLD